MKSTAPCLASTAPASPADPRLSSPSRRVPGLRLAVPLVCACAWALAAAPPAHGYATDVHAELSRQALAKSGLDDKAQPIDGAAITALRTTLDTFGRSAPGLHDAWVRRYPQPANFDAFAEKQLLMLSAGSSVIGIDRPDPTIPKDATLLETLARGSSQPDEDYRNRERLAYDAQRQPLTDKYGKPVPADPALLNMGNLGTLSSQAHAHYGLAQVEQSDDPEILKSDPRRFAKRVGYDRAPVITLAAEMAQIHLDLALISELQAAPTSRELGWQFMGEGFHYMQDVGNQAHTVQVGLFDFFFDAFIERLKLGLLTGGGYLGTMRSLGSIGVDILTNHHVLGEELTRKRVFAAKAGGNDPVGLRLLAAAGKDDPEFAAKLDAALAPLGAAPEKGEFALAITRALIEVSSHEGQALYRATRAIADPRLHTRSLRFNDEKDDPDHFVVAQTPETAAAYEEFWSLQERAFRRVGTAERRITALMQKALAGAQTPEARADLQKLVMQRLLDRQLKMLDEVDARLADYLKNTPSGITAPERAPGILIADLVLVGLFIGAGFLLIRRLRRRPAA